MNLLGAPNSWGDGLEWELDTKPTGRHFQAIFLAIGERTFAKNTTYFNYYLLWGISRINWGASAYSAKDIENLNNLIYEINILFRDREPRYTAGCFGKGRLEFDLGFNGTSSLRWYDDTNEDAPDSFYNKLIRNYQTKEISTSAGVIDYGGVLETMVNRCPMVMKCDKMSVANRKIMAWLIDLKNALNRMHTIFVPCGLGYPDEIDGITDTYYENYDYYKDDGEVLENDWRTGREQNMTDADLNIISGRVYNYKNENLVNKDYWASVRMPPISIQNQLPFSYKASLHISGYCRQGHYVSETEYYAIEPIGEYIKKIGWNEIGTLNPTEEKQILDASFCYDGNGARDYWNKYGNRDDCDINFKVNIDCIRLDFRVEGGFKFI